VTAHRHGTCTAKQNRRSQRGGRLKTGSLFGGKLMKVTKIALSCLVALCLAAWAQPAQAQDEAWTVVIKKVQVEQTKADGASWDVNDGKPDLAVIVRNLDQKGDEFTSKQHDDTFAADINQPSDLKFRVGQTIEFEVVDKDVAVNDTIGKVSKKMDANVLKEGLMKFEKFNRVILLEVEFKKLSAG
jgi:hypothetical protein